MVEISAQYQFSYFNSVVTLSIETRLVNIYIYNSTFTSSYF